MQMEEGTLQNKRSGLCLNDHRGGFPIAIQGGIASIRG